MITPTIYTTLTDVIEDEPERSGVDVDDVFQPDDG